MADPGNQIDIHWLMDKSDLVVAFNKKFSIREAIGSFTANTGMAPNVIRINTSLALDEFGKDLPTELFGLSVILDPRVAYSEIMLIHEEWK